MAGQVGLPCCLLLAAAFVALASQTAGAEEIQQSSSYIVHVAHGHAPRPTRRPRLLATGAYTGFLRDQLPEHLLHPEPIVHYSYSHAATGFAARLTRAQAAHLASLASVLAVVPDGEQRLHTTRSQKFLGLSTLFGLLEASNGAPDVVIGVIDSGVYPKDRASFSANPSLSPPPSWFRGGCVSTPTFNASAYCNNKLVGAKFFYKGYEAKIGRPLDDTEKSPLDTNGHGSHTASIAAGSAVAGASFFEYAKGRAVGAAPGAHVAAYKACWTLACTDSDVLAAFEEAIADGVHVISVSLGGDGRPVAPELHNDTVALAAFRAVRRGIVVSAAAGNDGPGEATVKNLAPWVVTVGASTINRQFPATVTLGNGKSFVGASLYAGGAFGGMDFPLVHGGDVGSSACRRGKLDARKVAGKIVLCDPRKWGEEAQGEAVRAAGGAGAILSSAADFGELTVAGAHILPATTVTFNDYISIRAYIIKSKNSATATIAFNGTTFSSKTPSSPRMASFSGRGPNVHAREILKPDVTAPGVGILAAWTGARSPTGLDTDARRVPFHILSGTSMACPHVSGVAAMLRQARPTWKPAAIKSAIMTTAYNADTNGDAVKDTATGRASTPFARGAGHVDPNGALEPGLVYDNRMDDYVSFLCALGYTAKQIALFTADGSATDCSTRAASSVGDLNYPAFSVVFRSSTDKVTQRRVVTNVGTLVCRYTVNVTSPPGVRVTVNPTSLYFTRGHYRGRYEVTFEPLPDSDTVTTKYSFGSLVWSDGTYKVTSPIAITWPSKQLAAIF